MEPYKLEISKQAQKILIEGMDQNLKDKIENEFSIDLATQKIYRIKIATVGITASNNRDLKRRSKENTDQLFVEIKIPDEDIKLNGIYPTSLIKEKPQLNFLGKILFTLKILSGSVQASGEVKSLPPKYDTVILATNIPPKAQWLFNKSYIKVNNNFNCDIIFAIPNEIGTKKYVICSAVSKQKNKTIDKIIKKRVELQL